MPIRSFQQNNRLTAILVVITVMASILVPVLSGEDLPSYPWSQSDLLEPAVLAQALNAGTATPHIFCVAFPTLYRQKHIMHARYAGPGNTPEGLQSLKVAVEKVPKSAEIVIYCGCCPMVRCPNLKPAYRMLKELGFDRVRVLNLPTTLLADWTSKGYPVDPIQ